MVDDHNIARERTEGHGLTRATVESLLETLLGRPRVSLRDVHTELVMVDKQRALLAQVSARKADSLFSTEEVELLLDAIEEHGARVPDFLFADLDSAALAPPPLTADEMRTLLGLCALRSGMDIQQLMRRVNSGLVAEQARLRAAFVETGELEKQFVSHQPGAATETPGGSRPPLPQGARS